MVPNFYSMGSNIKDFWEKAGFFRQKVNFFKTEIVTESFTNSFGWVFFLVSFLFRPPYCTPDAPISCFVRDYGEPSPESMSIFINDFKLLFERPKKLREQKANRQRKWWCKMCEARTRVFSLDLKTMECVCVCGSLICIKFACVPCPSPCTACNTMCTVQCLKWNFDRNENSSTRVRVRVCRMSSRDSTSSKLHDFPLFCFPILCRDLTYYEFVSQHICEKLSMLHSIAKREMGIYDMHTKYYKENGCEREKKTCSRWLLFSIQSRLHSTKLCEIEKKGQEIMRARQIVQSSYVHTFTTM